jgi:hypothetical protein
MKPTRAQEAAEVALGAAFHECVAANLDPVPHRRNLSELISDEVMEAVRELAVDKRSAAPKFVFELRRPFIQDIYFADAGRRAAHTLLKQLGVSHALLTTRRELPTHD